MPITFCKRTPVAISISCDHLKQMRKRGVVCRVRIQIWLACALSTAFHTANARVYTCETDTGRVVLRDVPCKKGEISREPQAAPQAPPAPGPDPKAVPKPRLRLTEPQVRELAQSLDTAFARHDLRQLQTLLAADAVFELEFRLPEGVQIARYSVADYTARLREGFRLSDYLYQRERNTIVISPGEEHAEIVASTRQTLWFQGQWQAASARNRWSVEMRDGRPQVTLLRAVITP
jgi:hypothetical protein